MTNLINNIRNGTFSIRIGFILFLTYSSLHNYWLLGNNNDIVFKQLSVEQGLPGENVRSIYQDAKGYMWFGIESAGLCKYDGQHFITYNTDVKNSNSISNSFINAIIEDENGDIWLATANGLNIFNRNNEIFNHYFYPDIPHNNINSLFKDSSKGIWIGTLSGITRFKPVYETSKGDLSVFGHGNGKIQYVVDTEVSLAELQNLKINCFHEDDYQIFWFGTSEGLFRYNYNTGELNHWKLGSGKTDNNSINRVIHIKHHYKDNYLLSTEKGLFLFNCSTGDYELLTFNQSGIVLDAQVFINFTYTDSEGVMWIGTASHGLITGPAGNFPENLPVKIDPPISVKGVLSPNIKGIYEDKSGQIWLITKFAGIFTYDRRSQLFPHIKIGDKNDNYIICGYERKNGNILFGSKYSGLFEFNRSKSTFTQHKQFIDDPMKKRIECILEDKKGDLWLGVQTGVIKTDQFGKIKGFIEHENVWTFLEDEQGSLWTGAMDGIYLINKREGRLERKKNMPSGHFLNNPEISVRVMLEDSEDNIWFGTDFNGIFRYNIITGKTDSFSFLPGNSKSLSGNTIRSIYEDSEGTIWIGTKSAGLNKLEASSESIQYFTMAEGLPSNTIFGIVEDKSGNLWLTTNNGVSKYDPKNQSFYNFNQSHGLQGNVFESRITLRLNNDDILFAGNNGFNIFSPGKVGLDSYSPPLVISSIHANGKSLKNDYFTDDELVIPHKISKLITFEFAALDFRDPGSIQYAYQLVGVDNEWVYSGNRNVASYTGLSHGKYHFKLKATNANRLWVGDEFNLLVEIQTPFYLSWWAYLTYTILVLIITFVVARILYTMISLKNKVRIEQQLSDIKLKFFTDFSHELRIPLTLIEAPIDSVLTKKKLSFDVHEDLSLAMKNIRRMSNMINEILAFRKVMQGKVSLQVTSVDIISLISNEVLPAFRSYANEKNIKLNLISEFKQLIVWVDEDKIQHVIFNLLSNALKFTNSGGSIGIEVSKQGVKENVLITVSDTGIGIPPDKLQLIFERFAQFEITSGTRGSGVGLSLCRDYIELHHGKLWAENNPLGGATFFICLPMGNSHLNPDEILKSIPNKEKLSVDTQIFEYDNIPRIKRRPDCNLNKEKPAILLVEDNAELRIFMFNQLIDDYQVIEAEDGRIGLQMAKEHRPDLIISDVMMPNMDGLEMTDKLRMDIETSHISVILLTAKSSVESRIQGLKYGADYYITKPFSMELLSARIKSLLVRRRELINNYYKNKNRISLAPSEIIVTDQDKLFIEKILHYMEENYANSGLKVDDLADLSNLSRTSFYMKFKSLSGKSPIEFINEFRLTKAENLIRTTQYNISEISYEVGFDNPSYFNTRFKEKYGISPGKYEIKN